MNKAELELFIKLLMSLRVFSVHKYEEKYYLEFKDTYTFTGKTPEDEWDEDLSFYYEITKEQYELAKKILEEYGE